eukprot:12239388-Karenia_brevis.AAC.1
MNCHKLFNYSAIVTKKGQVRRPTQVTMTVGPFNRKRLRIACSSDMKTVDLGAAALFRPTLG